MALEGMDIYAEDMVQPMEEPGEIQSFYSGATVFITGATGFVGKVLVEKLLRSCPDIKAVYLLLRIKKGKEPSVRFNEIFSDTLFNRLRQLLPNFETKLHIVEGNLDLLDLGIDAEQYARLCGEVDVVFHVAATVRFDEKIRAATLINVRGTREMLKLAERMQNLKSYVHVSTAYSQCPRREIDEMVYEMPMSAEKLLEIVQVLDDAQLEAVTPLLLRDWPNTYVYTKAVAEQLVQAAAAKLPVALLRPSIVVSTAKEPIPGWIDNLYGATGIAVGAAVGLLRTLHCDPNNIADLVPVDYVVNAMIAASWNVAKTRGAINNDNKQLAPAPRDVQVFNYVSSTQAPINWRQFMKLTEINAINIPSPVTLWHYCFKLNANWYIHMLSVYLFHFLPALVVDGVCLILGREARLLKGYKKINKFAEVISYFSSRQWKFRNDNVQKMWNEMEITDRRNFDFDMNTLSWDEYFYSYVRGMRVYLLKDPLDTIPQGRVKFLKLKIAHYFLVSIVLLGLLKLFWTVFTAIFGW